MRRLQCLLAFLAIYLFAADPLLAANRKPIVIGPTGQQQQLQSGDTLVNAAGTAYATGSTSPGGSSGQIQYNNAGAFGGAAVSGDCTAVVLAFTCTKLNGVSPGYFFSGTDAANLTGTLSAARIGSNALALGKLAQIGGNSYLGNTSSSTGDPTAYTLPGCTSSSQALHYTLGTGFSCASISGVSGGTNPFYIGTPNVQSGSGSPSASSDPIGSLYMRTDTAELYQQYTPNSATPTVVQAASSTSHAVTLGAAPTLGDFLVALCLFNSNVDSANSGWTQAAFQGVGGSNLTPGYLLAYHQVLAGDSTSQTPCSGTGAAEAVIWEISGITTWSSSYVSTNISTSSGAVTRTLTTTTTNNNTLLLAAFAGITWNGNSTDPGTPTLDNPTSSVTSAHAGSNSRNVIGASGFYTTSGTNVTSNGSASSLVVASELVHVQLKASTAGWRKVPVTLQGAGVTLETFPVTVNFSTGLSATTDGLGNVTVTNTSTAPTAANPTATASDAAVNGTATTFMRSDAAPAVQKGSSSVFGVVKVDNTTITAASGVISATGPTISGTPTTGNCAKWNSATQLADAGAACGSGGGGGTTYNTYIGYTGPLTILQRTTSQSITTATWTDVSWNTTAQQDDVSAFSSGSPTQVTVPSGYSKVRVSFYGVWDNNSTGVRYAQLQKNGTTIHVDMRGAANETGNHFTTEWISVTAGDVLKAQVNETSGSTINFSPTSGFAAPAKMQFEWGGNTTVTPSAGLPVISETVTSGSQSSVTVSSIPSTYRDLMVVVSGRCSVAAASCKVLTQLNGDTGANYDDINYQVNSSSVGNNINTQDIGQTSMIVGYLTGASGTASLSSSTQYTLYNYAGTTFNKVGSFIGMFKYLNSAGGIYAIPGQGSWRSSSAVTSLKVFPDSGNFVDGTVITVYGIGGSPTATLPVVPPQGRLTLTSNTPVMTADATAQTTIYYAPYVGSLLPVGNIMYRFSQLSFALNTTAHASGSLYDVFAYNSSGTITLCTGPAWTNSTTRSAAISQDATNGIWENTASLTCNLTSSTTTTTIAAGQATYLGTFYATANGQTGMAFQPTAASGGTNNVLGLWNAYNRVRVAALNRDSAGSWSYASTTWRAMNASNSNRITFVDGLQQSQIEGVRQVAVNSASGSAADAYIGMDLDSTSAAPQTTTQTTNTNVVVAASTVEDRWAPQLGLHYIQAVEATSANATFYGAQATPTRQLNALRATLEMHIPLLLPLFRRRRRRSGANDDAERIAA